MPYPNLRAIVLLFAVGATGASQIAWGAGSREMASVVNRGVVELETGPADDISVRMAAEIAGIVDDGATRRLVPVVGKGPLQNLTDLKYLRGIDLAIVQSDALDYAREQQLIPGLGTSLTYVAKLYNEEFHLLVRADIKSVQQLAGQTVNVDLKGSGSAATAARLFQLLNLNVVFANDSPAVALYKLRQSEIAAVALVAAKPAPLLQGLKPGDGLHLLAVPLPQAVTAAYAPSQLTSADYPNLLPDTPVDTIAVGTVLVAADVRAIPDRARNLDTFIDTFFTGFQSLLEQGHEPKWQEVDVAADLPGWTRHPSAAAWLQRNLQASAGPNPDALKTLFARFVDEHRQANGGTPMSAADKDALFQQFRSWQREQPR